MRRRTLVSRELSGLLFFGLVVAGCVDRASPGAVPDALQDDAGRLHAAAALPERVISLVPAITEVLLEIGAEDLLVARTQWDEDPRMNHLPSLGDALNPSLEAIAAFQPDLVIAWPDLGARTAVGQLSQMGISVYAAETETLEDLFRHTRQVGRLVNRRERAEALVEAVRGELSALEGRLRGVERPSLLYLIWPDPPQTSGGGTFIDQLVGWAGGENLFSDLKIEWPTVSLEEIAHRSPEVIVIAGDPAAGEGEIDWIRTKTGWRELTAVQEDQIFVVDAVRFNRPGPYIAQAAHTLAKLLHPMRFPEE